MAVSKWEEAFGGLAACPIDSISPGVNYGGTGTFNCGLLYLGGSKAVMRRQLLSFDLTNIPVSGSPLVGGEVINSAYLEWTISSAIGAAQAGVIDRITRDDWAYASVTWGNYKTGTPWTTAGGDVGTPPAAVAFTTPAPTDVFQTIAGLTNMVTDAIASRSSRVHLRVKFSNEADDGIDRYFSCGVVQLCVDYVASDDPPPRQVEGGGKRMLSRPQYDPIAGRRFNDTGRTLREIRDIGRRIERGVR